VKKFSHTAAFTFFSNNDLQEIDHRGQFLAPLPPTFLLENLPLQSTEFYKKLSFFFMTFAPNHLASKRWEKVGRQELRSTPYKQEINPRCASC
jgi:hypothetical protein